MKRAAALLLCTLPLLGGCVAAAIPVLAGAAVAKKGVDGHKDKAAPAPPPEQRVAVFVGEERKSALTPTAVTPTEQAAPAPAPAPAKVYTVVDTPPPAPEPVRETTSVARGPAEKPASTQPVTATPAPIRMGATVAAATVPSATPALLPPAEPMAPVPAEEAPKLAKPKGKERKNAKALPAAPEPAIDPGADSGYLGLTAYVLPRVNSPESTGVLDVIDAADPLGKPHRSQCGGLQPAVMIDLDPGLGLFDPARSTAEPGLAAALSALRAAGVTVLWSSALQVERAEEVHAALSRAGLDPQRTDRLLLLKGAGDRKQARRLSAARNWCVVAMAGDRRGDFDEAFDYLKDPDAVIPADKLFGDGWFLAPAPIP